MGIHEQFRAAWLLAREYGHQWANTLDRYAVEDILASACLPDATALENAVASGTAIRKAVLEAAPDEWEGISAPYIANPQEGEEMDPALIPGEVLHSTGTNRTRWGVRPDGSAWILIVRGGEPGGPCLRAEVSPYDGAWSQVQCPGVLGRAVGRTAKVEVVGPYARRHLEAMLKALQALLGPSRGFRLCAPLWAGAEMDPWEVEEGGEGLAPVLGGDRNV